MGALPPKWISSLQIPSTAATSAGVYLAPIPMVAARRFLSGSTNRYYFRAGDVDLQIFLTSNQTIFDPNPPAKDIMLMLQLGCWHDPGAYYELLSLTPPPAIVEYSRSGKVVVRYMWLRDRVDYVYRSEAGPVGIAVLAPIVDRMARKIFDRQRRLRDRVWRMGTPVSKGVVYYRGRYYNKEGVALSTLRKRAISLAAREEDMDTSPAPPTIVYLVALKKILDGVK